MAKAFGSITIIDVTDIGDFSVYPMSNMPLTIVYDADENSYTPTWTTAKPLELKPVVYYAGKNIELTDSRLSVSWQKTVGTSAPTDVTAGGNIALSNGILTIKENQFTADTPMITYTVTATYTDPSFGTEPLRAVGQITFSLVKNSKSVRDVKITGENIFKYNSDRTVDKASLTLTATTKNVTIDRWEYSQNGGATWINTGESGTTLTVRADSAWFTNGSTSYDKILIRVAARDGSDYVYDTIAILKLYDGTNASTKVFLTLSNESQMIPCDSKDATTPSAFDQASTKVNLYINGAETSISTSSTTNGTDPNKLYILANGVTGTWNSSTQTYTVTGWSSSNTGDTASVTFKYIYDGQTATKVMSLVKIKTGANGTSPTVYKLDANYDAITRDGNNGAYNISSVTFSAYSQTGTSPQAKYNGYLKIFIDDVFNEQLSTTLSNGTKTISGIGSTYNPVSSIRGELYAGSSTDLVLDSQTVVIVTNGAKGQNGMPAINVSFNNYSDIIPVTPSYGAAENVLIDIPFDVYCGTQKIRATASPGTICNNIAHVTSGTNASTLTCTDSTTGHVKYYIASGTNCGTTMHGTTAITFTIPAQNVTVAGVTHSLSATTIVEHYSWTLSKASTDGYTFQLLTPQGYVFTNGEGYLTVSPYLLCGTADVTNSATYSWAYYESAYTNITQNGTTTYTENGKTVYKTNKEGVFLVKDTKDLLVKGSAVQSFISFRCTANYDGHSFVQYASLQDKTDPIQAFIYSTIGDKITNGNGVGAVYCKVTRGGKEIDKMTSYEVVTSKPATLVSGRYYILLNQTTKTATLYLASSASAWAEPNLAVSYTWTYRNASDESITSVTVGKGASAKTYALQGSGKVIYMDAELINKRITIDVEVNV